jgi:hypothetical protein
MGPGPGQMRRNKESMSGSARLPFYVAGLMS